MSEDEPRHAFDTVILDLDGTLVDSVYQHVAAWRAAFLGVGVDVPGWRIHQAIGIGGDRLVAEVAGASVETAVGNEVRAQHGERFQEQIHQVTPTLGASELLAALRGQGLKVVVASSGEEEVTEQLLSLVGASEALHAWVSGSDVDESKPAPDLLDVALRKVSGSSALVVGDTIWDVEAAHQRSFPCLAVLTGGVSSAQLRQSGATEVFAAPGDIAEQLDRVLRFVTTGRAHQASGASI